MYVFMVSVHVILNLIRILCDVLVLLEMTVVLVLKLYVNDNMLLFTL